MRGVVGVAGHDVRGADGAAQTERLLGADDFQRGFHVRGAVIYPGEQMAVCIYPRRQELAEGDATPEEGKHEKLKVEFLILEVLCLELIVSVAVAIVAVGIAVVVVATGFEVDGVQHVGGVGEFAGVGEFLHLLQVALVNQAGADEVEGDIALGGQNVGVCQNAAGRGVHDDGIVLSGKGLQHFTKQGLSQQGDGVRYGGAGVEDVGAAIVLAGSLLILGDGNGLRQVVDEGGNIALAAQQVGGQAVAALTAEVVGERALAQVGVDEQYLATGLGEGGGQVGSDEGLALVGHAGGEQDDVATVIGARQEVVHIVAEDVQALGHGGVGVLNE